MDSRIGEKSTPKVCRRVFNANVKPNRSAPRATLPGRQAPKITRATAIHPRPATMPSAHCGVRDSVR